MDKVVLALVASSFSLGAAAAPQNQTPASSAASQIAGVRAFEEGRYREAVEQFSDAYRAHPQPLLLLSIAKSRYKLRQFGEAKQCLFDFLRDDPNGVAGSEAFDLLTRIEKESRTPQPQLPAACIASRATAEPVATKEPAAGAGSTPAPKDGVTAKEPAAVAVASDKGTAGSIATTDKTPASPAVAGEKNPAPAPWGGWQKATTAPPAAVESRPFYPVESRPFYKTWWFWTAAGVVAVGAATAIVLSAGGTASPPATHLGTTSIF